MKKVIKSEAPILLIEYFDANPNATWETFKKKCKEGHQEVVRQIKHNQGGICCYCESKFYDIEFSENDDFRVEHFHPKSDSSEEKNWHLDWNNLLGCCHGGSDKEQGNKFIIEHKHRHSDILKSHNNWDDKILNPLTDIPEFPPLFKIDTTNGTMEVIEENCQDIREKVLNCIDPTMLNLNTDKLKEFRKSVINALRDELEELLKIFDFEESINIMLNTHLTKQNDKYSAFFSTIRSYFSTDAEVFLRDTHFDG